MVIVQEKSFVAGVVEGFYGRPWTCQQRKEMFSRMQTNSMNTYIYAPKDDVKHRALWRQLYTDEEERKIEKLISSAAMEDITFVYAISPGLDISFACEADVTALKKKMKQVSKLGCKAFALLFDDINPTLKPYDATVFKSSAYAQSMITNEVYEYLNKPSFFFCPTEYCKTRALPNVQASEYLNTIGNTLYTEIDIMWTGEKVIPKVITKESIQELGSVLKRKPVIWDNIHANDYDQRRVFLGAYCGRPIELYPYLNGILTNPNCEFEANYVALHTLGSWCRSAANYFNNNTSEVITFEDVQMADLSDDDQSNIPVEMLPSLTVDDVASVVSNYNPKEAMQLALCDWIKEFSVEKKAPYKTYSKRNLKTQVINGQTVLTAVSYDLDHGNKSSELAISMIEDKKRSMELTIECVALMCDLFCLPYEHGDRGKLILNEFTWLLFNVCHIHEQPPSQEKVSRWFDRLLKCDQMCNDVYTMFENFCKIPNEAILYDLYPYIWDLKEVVLCLQSYVKWLSDSMSLDLQATLLRLCLYEPTDVSMSDLIEPWHINHLGGLTIHLHRLLPFKGSYLFLDNAPDQPSSNIVKIRSYVPSDKAKLYEYCWKLCESSLTESSHKDLAGDSLVGCYISASPKTLFIVEDNNGLCGYIASTANNQVLKEHVTTTWLPAMKEKYAQGEIHTFNTPTLAEWSETSSSHIVTNIKAHVYQECVLKRLLNVVLCVLKTCGSTETYVELHNETLFDIYVKLGFLPTENANDRLIYRLL